MPETASFSYDGNVVLNVTGGNESSQAKSVPTIEIKGVEHIIPVNVFCLIDGDPTTVTAYVDYNNMIIALPPTTCRAVVDQEAFKSLLLEFYEERDRREAVEYEAREMAEVEARRNAAKNAASVAAMRAAESRITPENDEDED